MRTFLKNLTMRKKLSLVFLLVFLLGGIWCFAFTRFFDYYLFIAQLRVQYARDLLLSRVGNIDAQVNAANVLLVSCAPGCLPTPGIPACDEKLALTLLLAAATKGSSDAQETLGRVFLQGELGVTRDIEKALSWYRQSAARKNIEAYRALAKIYAGTYSQFPDFPPDWDEAIKWYAKAAEAGDGLSSIVLANIYKEGRPGIPKNTENARAWGLKAALGGNKFRQKRLAFIYAETEPPDYKEAFYWAYFARERYLGTKPKSHLAELDALLEDIKKHLSPSQISAIEKNVKVDLVGYCVERKMDTCVKPHAGKVKP